LALSISRAVLSEPVENSDNSARLSAFRHILGIGRWCIARVLKREGYDVTVRIISILAVAITIGPSLAYGSPACMTQSEARAKFPKATHLYMHGSDHCWNDSTLAPVHSPRHPARAAVPAPSTPPALAAAPVPSPRPEIISTGIDAGAQCQYSPCE
jgi:hypothetical protein